MIKIAYVIDTIVSPRAGSENQLLKILAHLDRAEFEPHLITLRESEWLNRNKLPCAYFNVGISSIVSPGFIRARNRFAEYCRNNRIDLLQSFFIDSNMFAALCSRKAGVKATIAGRRSVGAGYWHSPKMVRIFRWLSKRTTHYVANSRAVAEETIRVERVAPNRVSVVPNAIDIERFSPPSPEQITTIRRKWGVPVNAIVIGAVANLRPVKNIPFLIEAAEPLIKKHDDLYFVVLGEGDLRPDLEQMIQVKNLSGRFLLPGSSTAVERDLYAFDIAVLCSHGESLSNSLMEYMTCARPSIASNVGGNRELLTSDSLGFLYEPGHHEQFGAIAERLITNPDLRKQVGATARASACERFSLQPVMAQWENLYRRLIDP
ncbi:MAG TPA: glycosyltransferase [candidate division Zixibacteria bacterium]|nr:glycosyltransferase [candidate division Zixibacteria bacterium]